MKEQKKSFKKDEKAYQQKYYLVKQKVGGQTIRIEVSKEVFDKYVSKLS